MLRIGLIGAGRIGKIHGESIANRNPNATLAAISDVYLPAAEELAAKLHVSTIYEDYRQILADPTIDAVAICSSSDVHAEQIIAAAEAGKHIFCEKPIAIDLAKIDEALAAVEKAGVKLFIAFQRRFDPTFAAAQAQVAAGKLGDPRLIVITARDPAPPPIDYIKKSGGLFFDMTVHDFDLARFFVPDSEIVEVYATGGNLVDEKIGSEGGDIDTAMVMLKYANGASAVINNCRESAYGYDQRLEWFGSGGQVQVTNHHPDYAVVSTADHIQRSLPYHFFLERYMDAYVNEMQSFIECVDNDTEPATNGIDGRWPVVLAMAATKSLKENRPVKISEID